MGIYPDSAIRRPLPEQPNRHVISTKSTNLFALISTPQLSAVTLLQGSKSSQVNIRAPWISYEAAQESFEGSYWPYGDPPCQGE